jgi:sugar O-acyltransferase (sialic acid O-acetyltransferase NeuD family)
MSREPRKPIVVVGAGGHAKVVVSTLEAAGETVLAAFDDDERLWGRSLLSVPIRGPVARLSEAGAVRAVIALGVNALRRDISLGFPDVEWITAVHPAAWVHSTVRLGPGTVVFAGAVIQPDTVLGAHVIVNTGASVDHDCAVGDFVHAAPGVRLAGGVGVGEGTLLGLGSTVNPGVRIGAWVIVGAGAAVVADLPDGVTAVGVPAKPLRRRGAP